MEETITYSWRSAIQAVMIVYREYYQENCTVATDRTKTNTLINESYASTLTSTNLKFLHTLVQSGTLPPSTRIQEISEGIIDDYTKHSLLSTPNPPLTSFHQIASVLVIIHTLGILLNDTLSLVAPLRDHILYWQERINATKGLNPLATTVVELWEGGPIEWYNYLRTKLPWLRNQMIIFLPRNDTPSPDKIALTKASASTTLSVLPHEYVAQLELLHTFLVRLIGMCRSRLAQLSSVTKELLLLPQYRNDRATSATSSSTANYSSIAAQSSSVLDNLLTLASRSVMDIGNCILSSSEHSIIIKDLFRNVNTVSSSSSTVPSVPILCRTIVHTLSHWSIVTVPYLQRTITQLSARPGYQRYWLRYTVVSIGAMYGLYYLNKNHKSIKETILTTTQSVKEFYNDHIGSPISQMIGEIFGGKRTHIADNNGLDLAKKELEKSIYDFNMNFFNTNGKNVNTLFPTLTVEEAKSLAQKLDMRTITESYANTINRPFTGIASGELLRIMFIQVSFIKKELLSALAAIDNLLMDNQFNLAIVATIPGILFISGSLNFLQNMYGLATAPLDTSDVRLKLRLLMRDLYRNLSLTKAEQRNEYQHHHDHQHHDSSVDRSRTMATLTENRTVTPMTTSLSTTPLPFPKASSLYATVLPCTCSCVCGMRETFDNDTHWIFAQLPGLLENISKVTIATLSQKEILHSPVRSSLSSFPTFSLSTPWSKVWSPLSTFSTKGSSSSNHSLSSNDKYNEDKYDDSLSSILSSSSSYPRHRLTTCSCCACDRIGQTALLTNQLTTILHEHFRRSQPISNAVTSTINGISWSEYVRLCEDMLDLCKAVAVTTTSSTSLNHHMVTDVDSESALTTWHRLHSTYSILGGHGQNDYSILSRLTRLS